MDVNNFQLVWVRIQLDVTRRFSLTSPVASNDSMLLTCMLIWDYGDECEECVREDHAGTLDMALGRD